MCIAFMSYVIYIWKLIKVKSVEEPYLVVIIISNTLSSHLIK